MFIMLFFLQVDEQLGALSFIISQAVACAS